MFCYYNMRSYGLHYYSCLLHHATARWFHMAGGVAPFCRCAHLCVDGVEGQYFCVPIFTEQWAWSLYLMHRDFVDTAGRYGSLPSVASVCYEWWCCAHCQTAVVGLVPSHTTVGLYNWMVLGLGKGASIYENSCRVALCAPSASFRRSVHHLVSVL